jgi:hypothetical protein
MAGPIYKFFQSRFTESWYQLSEAEQNALQAKGQEALKKVGGKRYDLASMGRRRANATYFESHGVDMTTGISYAMDLTPLILVPPKDINPFVQEHIQHFAQDVADRLSRIS